MYERFFGLEERPFDLTPNPRFLFMTPGHQEALSTIRYGITGRKGFTLVLGPAGTGKTTLVHAAIDLEQGAARAVYLGNPTLSRDEFFEFLTLEFGLSSRAAASKTQFLRELHEALLQRHASGTITALIVDEAQAMSDTVLEELRLLENLETPSEKLLPVVLVGQIEMADRLRQPSLLALKQRIALRSTLAALTASEAAAYIGERIRIAGGEISTIFTPQAIAAVCQACGGIPRNISVVCDNALVAGFALDERPIGPAIIAEVCRDFDLPVARVGAGIGGGIGAGIGAGIGVGTGTPQGVAAVAAAGARQPPATTPTALAVRALDIPEMSDLRMSDRGFPEETLMKTREREKPRVPDPPAPESKSRTGFGGLLALLTRRSER